MRRACIVFSIGLTVLFGSINSSAFSLRSPFKTEATKRAEIVKELKGKPFKHRIYGDIKAEVMRVVDGDTIYVRIPTVHPIIGYEIGIRVYGIDTREKDDGGAVATTLVTDLLKPGKYVTLRDLRRGKFFRMVADVIIDGDSLAYILIEKGLAYRYYGGTKRPKGWVKEDYDDLDGEELQ